MNQSFSIRQTIKDSWALVKNNLKFFISLALIAWVIQFIPSYINGQIANPTLAFIGSIVSWLVNSTVTIGLIAITLKYLRSGSASIQDARSKVNLLGVYLLGSIYYSLIVFVGIILLIVPGVIWAIRYQFYGYLIIDQGMKPKEAMAKSKQLTEGKVGKLFLFGLALLGVNLVGVLCLGVGLLVTIPISLIAVAKVYEQLGGKSPSAPIPSQTTVPAQAGQVASANPATNVWKNFRQN